MKKLLAFIAFFVLAMLMCMSTALAYIDPGAARGFYWRRIKRALTKRKNKDEEEEYDDDEEDWDEDEE